MNNIPLSTRKVLLSIFLSFLSCAFFVPILYLWIPEVHEGNVWFLIAIVNVGAFTSVFSSNSYLQKKRTGHAMAAPTAKKTEISVSAFWAAVCLLILVSMDKYSLQDAELWRPIALFLSLWLANLYACATLGRLLRHKPISSTNPPTSANQFYHPLHKVLLQQVQGYPYPVMIGIYQNTLTLKNPAFTLLMIVYIDRAFRD